MERVLLESKDNEISELVEAISPNVLVEDNEDGYVKHCKRKIRIIDPMVSNGGVLKRLSTLSKLIKNINENALARAERGVYLKIFDPRVKALFSK